MYNVDNNLRNVDNLLRSFCSRVSIKWLIIIIIIYNYLTHYKRLSRIINILYIFIKMNNINFLSIFILNS